MMFKSNWIQVGAALCLIACIGGVLSGAPVAAHDSIVSEELLRADFSNTPEMLALQADEIWQDLQVALALDEPAIFDSIFLYAERVAPVAVSSDRPDVVSKLLRSVGRKAQREHWNACRSELAFLLAQHPTDSEVNPPEVPVFEKWTVWEFRWFLLLLSLICIGLVIVLVGSNSSRNRMVQGVDEELISDVVSKLKANEVDELRDMKIAELEVIFKLYPDDWSSLSRQQKLIAHLFNREFTVEDVASYCGVTKDYLYKERYRIRKKMDEVPGATLS